MTPFVEFAVAVAVGLGAGVLSGLFGVGGGIVMTPGIQLALGLPPIVALATPLPAIMPTALTGAMRYHRSDQVDGKAAVLMAVTGIPAAAVGASLTEVVPVHALLVATAGLLGWQGVGVIRRSSTGDTARTQVTNGLRFCAIGAAAGLVSGLLGIGGGLVIVPLLVGWLVFPLKLAVGTSLAAIIVMVVPGTIVHAALGNIDWTFAVALAAGAVPGARLGANIALTTADRTLRTIVGSFMVVIAIAYGAREAAAWLGG